VLDAAALEGRTAFHRYVDTDGDGIAYRTLPGTHPRGAYFVRGSGHNQFGAYTEDAAEYQQVVDRLRLKWRTAARLVPEPEFRHAREPSSAGIVAVGSCDAAVNEALDRLAARGIHLDYCRVRAFPFAPSVSEFLERHERIVVVEQNRDAQLKSLLTLEAGVAPQRMTSILSYGGLPMDCNGIVRAIESASVAGAAA